MGRIPFGPVFDELNYSTSHLILSPGTVLVGRCQYNSYFKCSNDFSFHYSFWGSKSWRVCYKRIISLIHWPWTSTRIPKSLVWNLMKQSVNVKHKFSWKNLYKNFDKKRNRLRIITDLLTGSCPFRVHLSIMELYNVDLNAENASRIETDHRTGSK